MRERILTPFFYVERGTDTPGVDSQAPPPRCRPARELEGKVVGNGRFLLLRKTRHTARSVHFSARDLHGGLEVELPVHPDPRHRLGYRVGRARLSEAKPGLPNLCDRPVTREIPAARRSGVRMHQLLRTLRRRLGVK